MRTIKCPCLSSPVSPSSSLVTVYVAHCPSHHNHSFRLCASNTQHPRQAHTSQMPPVKNCTTNSHPVPYATLNTALNSMQNSPLQIYCSCTGVSNCVHKGSSIIFPWLEVSITTRSTHYGQIRHRNSVPILQNVYLSPVH